MGATRRCPRCPRLIPAGTRYCPTHQAEYEAGRGTPTQRGYGTTHRTTRTQWQARIDAGEPIYCADGCGARIIGTAWHLGHSADRSSYIGPQTIACNTREGGQAAHQPERQRSSSGQA